MAEFGFGSTVKDEPDEAEEVSVVEESVVSGGEEEWPSLGLDLGEGRTR